jgi:hypothetical protein
MKSSDGASQIYYRTAELFDPEAKTFVKTADMNSPRSGHIAVLLRSGKVLIAGGFTGSGITTGAEIYDPSTGVFSSVGSMHEARGNFTATLLDNGNVLVAGGGDVQSTTTAEIFHPDEGLFFPTGRMSVPRRAHTAVLLPGGNVLIAGGLNGGDVTSTAELYDPRSGKFAAKGSMQVPRCKHASVLLSDGSVLFLGGSRGGGWREQEKSAEVYDPASGKFRSIASMLSERFKFPAGAVRLSRGDVLVSGGSRVIEVFEARAGRFKSIGHLDEPHYFGTATVLGHDAVLMTGGYTVTLQATDAAWIFEQ